MSKEHPDLNPNFDMSINQSDFDQLSESDKSEYIRKYYNSRDGRERYATSPDFNLRELEIEFIIENIKGNRVLDLGCGNGYTLIRIAEKRSGELLGVDFSSEMVAGAHHLAKKYRSNLKCEPRFWEADATSFDLPDMDSEMTTVVTQRFLLNLPNEETQYSVIRKIHSYLSPRGIYIMIEGSKDGLDRLNELRTFVCLDPIPDRDEDNLSSRKFDDNDLLSFMKDYFELLKVKTFDLYYFISRVIYPKIIYPDKPQYEHEINKIARQLVKYIDVPSQGIGHVKGYIFRKL